MSASSHRQFCVDCGTYHSFLEQCGRLTGYVSNNTVMSDAAKRALDTQEGGSHYKSMAIQPVEYIHANNIGYCEGAVIKYVSRWRNKNGIEDLRKAKHFIDLLIELETNNASEPTR